MKTVLKWTIGLGLIAALVSTLDWHEVLQQVSGVTYWASLLALVLLTLQFPLSSWKWSWALRLHGLEFPVGYLLRVMLIGYFFNNFLPTSIGGDVYRIYRTAPADGYLSRSFSAVAIERITGLGSLLLLGAIGAAALAPDSALARSYLTIFLLGAVCGCLGLAALYKGWLKPLTSRFRRLRIFQTIEHNLGYILRFRKEWLPLLGLSLLFQAVAVLTIWILFRGLGQEVSPAECALIASAAAIAAIVPISINGLGVVEATYAGTAVALGVDHQAAVVVSILLRVLTIPHGIIAGLLYLGERPNIDRAEGSPGTIRGGSDTSGQPSTAQPSGTAAPDTNP